jgi:hypothetical protein
LGVFKGEFTPRLLNGLRPTLMYVVDSWYLRGPRWEWAPGDQSTVRGLRRVLDRISGALESGQAHIVIADDRDFLARLDDDALDWVYLDSSHKYEQTVLELSLLVIKVKPGGVIAGDDWQPDVTHRHHGVCRAVREYAERGLIELVYTDETSKQWAARVIARGSRPRSAAYIAASAEGPDAVTGMQEA